MRSVVKFLQKNGFDISFKNEEKRPDFTATLVAQSDIMLRIKRHDGIYSFWVVGKSSLIDITSVSLCQTFPVLMECAYDRIRGLKLAFHDSDAELERRMAVVEDVILTMFDRIMGDWD